MLLKRFAARLPALARRRPRGIVLKQVVHVQKQARSRRSQSSLRGGSSPVASLYCLCGAGDPRRRPAYRSGAIPSMASLNFGQASYVSQAPRAVFGTSALAFVACALRYSPYLAVPKSRLFVCAKVKSLLGAARSYLSLSAYSALAFMAARPRNRRRFATW